MNALDSLRNYLLPKTIDYASVNSPFYRAHFGNLADAIGSLADLPRLPLINKAIARQNQEQMRCGRAEVDFGAVSSGTTSRGREFLHVQHCWAEDEAIAQYFSWAAQAKPGNPPPQPPGPPPIYLHLFNPSHGVPRPTRTNVLRLAWVSNTHTFRLVERALTMDFDGRSAEILHIGVPMLKQLTAFFRANGVDFSRFRINTIGTAGYMVTDHWRRIVENAWGAKVFDNYSLSEFATPATECEHCGWFHFVSPPLVAEVVSVSDRTPITEGVGELVLTGLYPFVQRQPLIRYATGDLVQIGPVCPMARELSFRCLGRKHQTVLHPSARPTRVLVSPAELEQLADSLPEVSRHTHPVEVLGALPPETVGQSKFWAALDKDRGTVKVVLGVRFPPHLFPESASQLTEKARCLLLKQHPGLQQWVEETPDGLLLTLSGPGDPEPPWFAKFLG